MIATHMIIADIVLMVVGFCGFLIAFYIHFKKKTKKPLICPLRSNCNVVIESDYSKLFGIPLELIGMCYYAFVVLLHALVALVPSLFTPLTVFISLTFSTIAFLFSLYLTAIQAFILKQWCAWCLTSAVFCVTIFMVTLFTSPIGVMALLVKFKLIVTILHLFGAALGVGAATVTDILFFKFLKDLKISEEEADIMKTLSRVIWVALLIIICTGFLLYLPQSALLHSSGKFLTKMVAVFVLVANGFLLNIVVQPQLAKISFQEAHVHVPGELNLLRKLSFALGSISITSWYFVFVLGAVGKIQTSFETLFLIYVALLIIAIGTSQLFERRLSQGMIEQ